MKTWDISEKAGLLLWEGKGLWLWQFVCGQKANSGASVPYDFYMNKIGDSKSRNKRRCFEEGESTSTTAKNICFNCLPSSLQAVKLFTLGKIRNRRDFQTVCTVSIFCVPGLLFLHATFIWKLACQRHQKKLFALFFSFHGILPR